MNDLERMIMREISTLDEMRLIDVLGFIRFIKKEMPGRSEWIEGWFEQSLKDIYNRKDELQITPADIQEHIRMMRGDE